MRVFEKRMPWNIFGSKRHLVTGVEKTVYYDLHISLNIRAIDLMRWAGHVAEKCA